MDQKEDMIQEPPITNPVHLYLIISIMSLVAVIAIAGNMLIVFLFLRIKKFARLTPHIFLTNLALADLILGLKLPLFFLVTLASRDPWIFNRDNEIACLIGGATDSFSFRIVVAGMISVAIDRYLAVIHATRYSIIMTEKRAILIIVCMWCYCIFWSILPTVFTDERSQIYTFSVSHNMCTIKATFNNDIHRILIATDLIFNFVVPLTIMTVCYFMIGRKVLSTKHVGNTIRKFMRNTSRSLRRNTSGHVYDKNGYNAPDIMKKVSLVGIKIDAPKSKEQLSDCEEDDDDDYIELPAITKHFEKHPVTHINGLSFNGTDAVKDNMELGNVSDTTNRSTSPVQINCDIQSMYARTGLNVNNSPNSKYRINSSGNNSSRGSWTDESAAVIRDGARKLSTTVTTSVLNQLKRFSHASNAFSKMSKYQQKIARTTLVVYFSFFICFTPFICCQVLILTHPPDAHLSPRTTYFVFTSVCIVYLNACVNVIIYGTMHRNIKNSLRGMFH